MTGLGCRGHRQPGPPLGVGGGGRRPRRQWGPAIGLGWSSGTERTPFASARMPPSTSLGRSSDPGSVSGPVRARSCDAHDHRLGAHRHPDTPEPEGHRGNVAAQLQDLRDPERPWVDAQHTVVLGGATPGRGRARPDPAGPDRRRDGPRGQLGDPSDPGGRRIGLEQTTAVGVSHIDSMGSGATPWGPKSRRRRAMTLSVFGSILTSQPAWSATQTAPWPKAMLCGLPRPERLPTTWLVAGSSLDTEPLRLRSSSLPVQTKPPPKVTTDPK
jgi:hypothetical protein